MMRIRYHSLGQTTAGDEPLVMPPADPFVVPSSPATPMVPVPAAPSTPGSAPSPSSPLPPAVDLQSRIKALTESPLGKMIAIGSLTAAIAKTFPGKFFFPFIAGAVLSTLTGIVPEPTNESLRKAIYNK